MKMRANYNKISIFLVLLVSLSGTAVAQSTVTSPCPEVLCNEKYDHIPMRQYRNLGWDTAVTCEHRRIMLTAEPYIPVQYFNGTYVVESIPYNPPDTSFWMNGNGQAQAINSDDRFAPSAVNIAFPFYFFGIRKNYFRLGDNGIVTFTTGFAQDGTSTALGCPYSFSSGIPWTTSNTPTYSGDCFNRMHDAIYGVYEDTYTGVNGAYMSGHQGIYYGVMDEFPCRKILCTWNQIPVYSDQTKRQSYQIVCYEGSNIIEVHVKQRCAKPSTSNGIIGIQNATGVPQVPGTGIDPNTHMFVSNYYVANGAPAAFAAPGWNPQTASTGVINNIAFRFTPQGNTVKQYTWYRIFDDGRDSVVLGSDQTDTNGYFIPMNENDPDHPTLTKAWVSPNCPSRYVIDLRFMNANGDWYFLRDTITIGVDTAADMEVTLLGADTPDGYRKNVCQGQTATAQLTYPANQAAASVRWNVQRVLNGQMIGMPSSLYGVSGDGQTITLLPDPQFDTLPHNKIDTILIQASVDFVSGCNNFASVMVRVFPNFDTTIVDGICRGQNYQWNPGGNYQFNFTDDTDPEIANVTLQSQPGCDSVVRLKLTVYDVSLTIDDTMDCKPITWLNGRTYTESNTATAAIDTIVLQNRYGCDSVVRLNFTIHPLTARIQCDIDHFTLDHLDAVLTDISTGGDSRRWVFPNGNDQTGATAYYTIQASMDEADIKLIAHSPYGCLDSTHIVIPLQKETFWVPNAFTPDNNMGNNTFSSVSTETVKQEMYIYNRMGALVFRCEGVDCEWNGRDNDGNACPQGAYVYIIRYTNSFEPNITRVLKGSVTLIR